MLPRSYSRSAAPSAQAACALEVFRPFLARGQRNTCARGSRCGDPAVLFCHDSCGLSRISISLGRPQPLLSGFGSHPSAFKDLLFPDGWRNWLGVRTFRQLFNCLQITESIYRRFLMMNPFILVEACRVETTGHFNSWWLRKLLLTQRTSKAHSFLSDFFVVRIFPVCSVTNLFFNCKA